MKLQHKVIFITDADSNSGKTLIDCLAVEGANFILNSISDGEAIQSNLNVCLSAGSKALVVNINLCRSSEVEEMLRNAVDQLGTVDVLVHNNNLVKSISVETGSEDDFHEIMNYNAKSAFICSKAVGLQMKDKQSGKVIFINSIHAEKPTGSTFAFSTSKSAVKMLAREASIVLGRHGINVNSIEFGPVEGEDIVFKSDLSTLYDSYQYKVPNAILGSHEDLANLVLFLSTDEARYINGADIRMDGGFLMHYMDFKMKRP